MNCCQYKEKMNARFINAIESVDLAMRGWVLFIDFVNKL
jgi:hypothetical protein